MERLYQGKDARRLVSSGACPGQNALAAGKDRPYGHAKSGNPEADISRWNPGGVIPPVSTSRKGRNQKMTSPALRGHLP